jgi:hypothetical protein
MQIMLKMIGHRKAVSFQDVTVQIRSQFLVILLQNFSKGCRYKTGWKFLTRNLDHGDLYNELSELSN